MTTYVWRASRWVEKDKAVAVQLAKRRFNIIPDFADPVRSTIDGKHYGSRRQYLDHVKAHGCQVVGNDLNNAPMERPARDDPSIRADIARSMAELNS